MRHRNTKRLRLGVAIGGVLLLLIAAAPSSATVLDLTGPAGRIRVDGHAEGDAAGFRVAAAGDVNGDGKPDFIVGAPFTSANGRQRSGSAYVVYGGSNLASIDLGNLGSSGFRIDGALATDLAGYAVGGGGDVNGDGIDDVVVGALGASIGKRDDVGAAYVIYGRRAADPPDVDLANITTTQSDRGFRIDGVTTGDGAGRAVALADINADGQADVVVGAPTVSPYDRVQAGAVYVVYGQRSRQQEVDLASFTEVVTPGPSPGFRIAGAVQSDQAGMSVADAGDVNGDGIEDLVLGAPDAGNGMRAGSGSAYIVYGERSSEQPNVDLGNIATLQDRRGFRIDGAAATDAAGQSVAGDVDVNRDGVSDVVVAAPAANANGRTQSGSVYVIYGQRAADLADLDLAAITTTQASRGWRIDGAAAGDIAGFDVALGRDLTGDGRADVVIGAPAAANNGRTRSGSVYVVSSGGAADPADVDLAALAGAQTSRVVRLDGPDGGLAGYAVAAGGDLNGDGHPDAILSAPAASTPGGATGATYVIDLAGPETVIDAGPTVTNDVTPSFRFHGSEPGAFLCSIDHGTPAFGPCSGAAGTDTPTTPLRDGTYTFRVKAVDQAGNVDLSPAVKSFTVDTTAPNTRITAHPPAQLTLRRGRHSVRVTFALASSERGSTFRCRLDRERYGSCAQHVGLMVGPGRHAFSVVATDAVGNTDQTAARFAFVVKPRGTHRRLTKR